MWGDTLKVKDKTLNVKVDVYCAQCQSYECYWPRPDPGVFTQGQGYKNPGPKFVVNTTFSDSRIDKLKKPEWYSSDSPNFATAVDPRLTEPVQPHKRGPSNRRILIAVGMAIGCGLTLLFELILGG
jgi:hypothetical protein